MPKPTTPPIPRPLPLWQRALERFHKPFDARTTADYAETISDWAELPPAERQGHGMHLVFRLAGGVADVAGNLREIRVLLARELPAIRRRLGELESLVDEHGTTIAAGRGVVDNDTVGEDDQEEPDEGAELDSDEDLDAEFERQQAGRVSAPKVGVETAAKSGVDSAAAIVPDAIIAAPLKPKPRRMKPFVIEGSSS